MFGIEKAELTSHVFYRDASGALKHTGDKPFRFVCFWIKMIASVQSLDFVFVNQLDMHLRSVATIFQVP